MQFKTSSSALSSVLSRMAGCTLADPGVHSHAVSCLEPLSVKVCSWGRILNAGHLLGLWERLLGSQPTLWRETVSFAHTEGGHGTQVSLHVFVDDRHAQRDSALVWVRGLTHG